MRHAVQQWRESGLTQKAYCEKLGIKRTTFANWVKRSKAKPGIGFIAITPPAQPTPGGIELIYPNGVRLKTSSPGKHILSELIRIW